MDKNDKKEKKKRILVITGISLGAFLVGNMSGYYLNPKCGEFKDSTKYVLNGIKNLFTAEETVQIIETPIECNCPVCNKSLEKEDSDKCPIKADISGAVRNPGVYCFEEGSVIQDAVDRAKGFDTAYGYKYISRKINLAYELKDNQKIYFPFDDDLICKLQSFSLEVEKEIVVTEETEGIVEGSTIENTEETADKEESTDCISINTAIKEDLMELNGVGESTAQKIIDGRPYAVIEDIKNVKGIGDATFEKMKDYICL